MKSQAVNRNAGTIIIGAGLSGLTAAYTLHQAGHPYILLEAAPRPGGLIQTITEHGFQIEAGPHTFPSTAQELLTLCESLGLKPKETNSLAQKRYLYLNGRLVSLPSKPWQAISTPALSWRGKLRVLQEPFQPRTMATDISVADFVENRLGAEVLHNLVDPFISGIYAGNVAELSLPAVFPKLWEWEQTGGSLFKGAQFAQKKAVASRTKSSRHTSMRLLSFARGLRALIEAISRILDAEHIRYEYSVTGLEALSPDGFKVRTQTGEMFEGQSIILATPAHISSRLLRGLNATASQALFSIPYNSLTVVHLGFPRSVIPHSLDGFGCLIPRKEKLPLLGVIWASSLFPGRVPPGQCLLSCYIGGAHHPEIAGWPPENIQQLVLDNLQRLFKAPALSPTFSRVLNYEKAIPQYTLGHRERIETIENALAKTHSGLFLCGNYLHGIALNECVKSGQAAADQVLHPLQKK